MCKAAPWLSLEFNYLSVATDFRKGSGLRFLLDVHYRAHPGVDTALELMHPGGKLVDPDGSTGSHDRRSSQAGWRWD